MNFKALVFLLALARLGAASAVAIAPSENVKDHFDFTARIVTGLSQLSERPNIRPINLPAASVAQAPRSGKAVAVAKAAPTPSGPRTLIFKKNTVYGLFELTVTEWPDHFGLNVKGSVPAQEIVIKKGAIELAKKSLNDQMACFVEVPYPLTNDIGVSLAVNEGAERGEQRVVRVFFKIFDK